MKPNNTMLKLGMVLLVCTSLGGLSHAELWTNSTVLGPNNTNYPFAGIYQFDNLTLGDGVEVTSSNISQLD